MKPYHEAMREARRQYVADLMAGCGGCVSEAARVSGLHRSTLYGYLRQAGIRSSNADRRAHRGNWASHGL